MAVARRVPVVLRTLAALSLLMTLVACSGSDEPDTAPEPSATASTDELDVVVTDPGAPADPGRVAALVETVSAELAAGTGSTDACPLGEPTSFVHGPVADPGSFSNRVRTSGTVGQVPTVSCTSIGSVQVEVSRLTGGTTLADVVDRVRAVVMRPTFSTPQLLAGGQAVVGCAQSESAGPPFQCGITWVMGELAVHVTVSDLSTEPQQLADYLSAALPAWVAAR